ncbi:MAG: prevent-host-death protein [Rhizobium sp.]|nr:prevent-host-death protein [Rhizobium sp.]
MAYVNVSDFRQNLAAHLDEVENSRAPLFVTRNNRKAMVVMSEEEYESMMETLHLTSNPVNAQLLRESIAEMNAGRLVEHDIVELNDAEAAQ